MLFSAQNQAWDQEFLLHSGVYQSNIQHLLKATLNRIFAPVSLAPHPSLSKELRAKLLKLPTHPDPRWDMEGHTPHQSETSENMILLSLN